MKNTISKTVIILLFILLCACKKETTKYITTKYIPNQIGIWKGSSLSSTGMNTPLLLEIIADSIAMSYDGNPPTFITYPILRGSWVIKDYAFTAKLPFMADNSYDTLILYAPVNDSILLGSWYYTKSKYSGTFYVVKQNEQK